jgi:hypothetical protein
MFWLISWLVLTPLCMWGAYAVEMHHGGGSDAARHCPLLQIHFVARAGVEPDP